MSSIASGTPLFSTMTATAAGAGVGSLVRPDEDPLDRVIDLLYVAGDLQEATRVLRAVLPTSPYAEAWLRLLDIQRASSSSSNTTSSSASTSSSSAPHAQLSDAQHRRWMELVGADFNAAPLYVAAALSIAARGKDTVGDASAALEVLHAALAMPLADPSETLVATYLAVVAQRGGPLQGGSESSHRDGGSGGLPASLHRAHAAAVAVAACDGPWPARHHTGGPTATARAWTATLQRMFATYAVLARAVQGQQQQQPTSVLAAAHPTLGPVMSRLPTADLERLCAAQVRRLQTALRQAVHQCPNNDHLRAHYVAFIAAAGAVTAGSISTPANTAAVKALQETLAEQAQHRKGSTNGGASTAAAAAAPEETVPAAFAALCVALQEGTGAVATPAALQQTLDGVHASKGHQQQLIARRFPLTSTTTTATSSATDPAPSAVDGSVAAAAAASVAADARKRVRDIGKSFFAPTEAADWRLYAQWLDIEAVDTMDSQMVAQIAKRARKRLQDAAMESAASAVAGGAASSSTSTDELTLFTHTLAKTHVSMGAAGDALRVMEQYVHQLATPSVASSAASARAAQQLPVPAGSVDEAFAALAALEGSLGDAALGTEHRRRLAVLGERYVNGSQERGADVLTLALRHRVGVALWPCTDEELEWAAVVGDLEEAARRYPRAGEDDSGQALPNRWLHRAMRCEQAMPWGVGAYPEDGLSAEPLRPALVGSMPSSSTTPSDDTPSGWAPFVAPSNPTPIAAEASDAKVASDECIPRHLRGTLTTSALTVDARTTLRIARDEAHRTAEGKRRRTEEGAAHLPAKVAQLIAAVPPTAEGCTNIANASPQWLIDFITAEPLELDAVAAIAAMMTPRGSRK